jgi:hypothetical protein
MRGIDCDGGGARGSADWPLAHGDVDETAIAATNAAREARLRTEFREKLRSRKTSISIDGGLFFLVTADNKDAEAPDMLEVAQAW